MAYRFDPLQQGLVRALPVKAGVHNFCGRNSSTRARHGGLEVRRAADAQHRKTSGRDRLDRVFVAGTSPQKPTSIILDNH